jgi:hypothetical protein
MINVHFVILGAACSLLGQAFYIRDTLRGATCPNRVTWLLWGAAPMLAFAAEVHEGVGLRSLMTFTVGFGPLLVVAASFVSRNAVWQITRIDWACGALSVAGTGLWLATRQGAVAIVASIAADALAGVPTLVKSWRAPDTESAGAYVGSLANAVLTLLTVTTVSLAVVAFPAYIAAITTVEVVLVGGRAGPRLRAGRRRPAGKGNTGLEAASSSEVPDAPGAEPATDEIVG